MYLNFSLEAQRPLLAPLWACLVLWACPFLCCLPHFFIFYLCMFKKNGKINKPSDKRNRPNAPEGNWPQEGITLKNWLLLGFSAKDTQQTCCFTDLKCVISVGVQRLQSSWFAPQALGSLAAHSKTSSVKHNQARISLCPFRYVKGCNYLTNIQSDK